MSQVKDLVDAIDAFIVGCKDDGIWDAIKACCIMAAWDGLTAIEVPLKGAAPTNNNFVSGDYDRKTGLVGDGTTKYLDSNRNNNADPQDDRHLSVFSQGGFQASSQNVLAGAQNATITSVTMLQQFSGNMRFFAGSSSLGSRSNPAPTKSGLYGLSRASSSEFATRFDNSNQTFVIASAAPHSGNHYIFSRNLDGASSVPTDARISFYSIGESLDLALLDSRVSTLMTAIGAAIP